MTGWSGLKNVFFVVSVDGLEEQWAVSYKVTIDLCHLTQIHQTPKHGLFLITKYQIFQPSPLKYFNQLWRQLAQNMAAL